MTILPSLPQRMPMSWHEGGLFMGMHWLWWAFWIGLLAVLLAAFWRLWAERSQTKRAVVEDERAEAALRQRFANGEIDEDEYARKLKMLRESLFGR